MMGGNFWPEACLLKQRVKLSEHKSGGVVVEGGIGSPLITVVLPN